jgi:hypothetical protein
MLDFGMENSEFGIGISDFRIVLLRYWADSR